MTGAYVRVQRDGRWENVEIDQLTYDELTEFFERCEPERRTMWARFLAVWIRDNVVVEPLDKDGSDA